MFLSLLGSYADYTIFTFNTVYLSKPQTQKKAQEESTEINPIHIF